MKKFLFCTDGSAYAENAMKFGAILAKALQAEVTVFSVAEKDFSPAYAVTNAISLLAELGVKAGPKIVSEAVHSPEEAIIEESIGYYAIVIGSHGKGGLIQYVFGSTSYKIIKHASVSVLVVRSPRKGLKKILACLGTSEYSFKVLRAAGKIAKESKSEIALIAVAREIPERVKRMMMSEAQRFGNSLEKIYAHPHRLDEEALEKGKKILETEFGLKAEMILREGDAGNEILAELEKGDYDLVILGSHDEGDKLRLGSVSSKVATYAKAPVLVLRRLD